LGDTVLAEESKKEEFGKKAEAIDEMF